MDSRSPRWHQITPSEFAWEQEALDHVRELLPDRDPVQAWANFEFVSDTGRVYEVDLLVVTAKGVFLVEIKSRPGRVEGNGGAWTWHTEGRIRTDDNPLILANRKAKALKSLLDRQQAMRSAKQRTPWVQAAVFLSAEKLANHLSPDGAHHVYGRDDAEPGPASLPSIKDGLLTIDPEQYARKGKAVDRPTSNAILRAMDQAGIRPSNLQRRVGDYELGDLIHDGPGYQDFVGRHLTLSGLTRRVRVYSVPAGTDPEVRRTRERAAEREFRVLSALTHSSILAVHDYTVSDLGPALLFDHHPKAVRLDRFLADYGDRVDLDMRLSLVRQIAEALAYAHGRRVVHRALSPASIEVVDPDAAVPRVTILNWQTSARDPDASVHENVSGTRHLDRLVDAQEAAYMAPEVFGASEALEQADVFSLGALAYLIFSGQPPATSLSELVAALHETQGLAIESALDGASQTLSEMVRWATHPQVSQRLESVQDFLELLADFEAEVTEPEAEETVDPAVASVGDLIAPGLEVASRLGRGSSAVVFQIADQPEDRVLKVAVDPDQNERLRAEAEILEKLQHPSIVRVYGQPVSIGDRLGVWMQRAGDQTLAQQLRGEGPLQLDLLQRFGTDLLDVVEYLENEGVAHRDIKPANLAVAPRGKKGELRLMLFDFSLSRTPREAIHAGTPPYLDPFLVHRTPQRWDEQAERFAAAVTLYEMATAQLPVWGDGLSDPAALKDEVTIDQELFEPSLAPALSEFFRTALARDPADRFATVRDMRDAWQAAFSRPAEEAPSPEDEHVPIESATPDTALRALDLDVTVVDVLERASIYDVRALLQTPLNDLNRRRGIGTKTKRRIGELVTELRRLMPELEVVTRDEPEPDGRSIDPIAARLVPKETPSNAASLPVLRALLGLDESLDLGEWPSQATVCEALGVSRRTLVEVLKTACERWKRSDALTSVAADIADIIDRHDGVVTTSELAAALLVVRGSSAEEPERTRRALAVARAAVETERSRGSAMAERRIGSVVLLAPDPQVGAEPEDILDYVARLGAVADELAGADPLLAPAAVLSRLEAVDAPDDMEPLSDTRRVRLAAAASTTAAASSRLELYPRGMPADRAIRLAQTALLGPSALSPADIRQRVHARFPEAGPIPDHPELDALLAQAGLAYRWDTAAQRYTVPSLAATGLSSRTSFSRRPTGAGGVTDVAAEEAARFDERLRRAVDRGGFLALTTDTAGLPRAERQLDDLPLTVVDVDRLLLEAMQREAQALGADWSVVVRADAADRDSTDWERLQQLVRRVIPRVEERIADTPGVAVLTHAGLLGRYGHVGLIERLRDAVIEGSAGALRGLWVLTTAADDGVMPMLDGVELPVVTPDQSTAVPRSWLENAHRAGAST